MAYVHTNGYVLVSVGAGHHLADKKGRAYEHRLVMEEKIGRRLLPGEIPHHIDGNKRNNDPSNLELMASVKHHHAAHRKDPNSRRGPDESNPLISCACGCGTEFLKYDGAGRARKSADNTHQGYRAKVKAEFKPWILSLEKQGFSHAKIAAIVGCGKTVIGRHIQRWKTEELINKEN